MSTLNEQAEMLRLMEQDSGSSSLETLDQESLGSVAGLAKAIKTKEELIESLEQTLKEEKKALIKMTDEDLPTMLMELGMQSLTLDDGSDVTVKQTYGASIRVDDRPAAYEWLRDNGYDDIIKNQVLCVFGRGEDDMASAFQALASQQGYAAEQKTEIHPQTLRAFVKERVENGDDFPMELFGAWVGQRAVIKRNK
jgi:hypothetical protein|tara:strand:- start:715 stop:1302 length:588 start_codon:yes stop_codon:yes gene_type:complete